MDNYRSLFLICLILLSLSAGRCSDQGSSGKTLSADQVIPEDTLITIESYYVKQGSCQCGPTSFYMIFKFYGDNKIDGSFWDLPGCATEYSLKEDLSVVEKTSLVSRWLGVTCGWFAGDLTGKMAGGITIKELDEKIRNLTADKANPYYNVASNIVSNTDDSVANLLQFNRINDSFLQQLIPVIIHLDRSSLYAGHFMVLAGYDSATGLVYYIDPNKNDSDPVLQSVSLTDFINSHWYISPDDSSTNPNAYWDGTWIGFTHAD